MIGIPLSRCGNQGGRPDVLKATKVGATTLTRCPLTEGPLAGSLGTGASTTFMGKGTYHTPRGVHLTVSHALEVARAAPVVPRAVTAGPEGGQQVVDGFKVRGQHRVLPWGERGWLNPRDIGITGLKLSLMCITFEIIIHHM